MISTSREKKTAEISVAISTRNRPDDLSNCLAALLNGDVLPGEIIIVDQSTDSRTQQVIESCDTDRVSLVYVPYTDTGLGKSQNIAFDNANYAIVAVTDDDCIPAADWIAQVECSFLPQNEVDVLTGQVLAPSPLKPGLYPVSTRMITERKEFSRQALPWEIGSGNNFAVKRSWFQTVGGNDERLGPGSPGKGAVDMDLFYRLLRAGACIRYEPDLLVYHAPVDRRGRLKRRIPYGYGMGACCSLWLRQGDSRAVYLFFRWLLYRLRRMVRGLLFDDLLLTYEEGLVLTGTMGGIVYGLRQGNDLLQARG